MKKIYLKPLALLLVVILTAACLSACTSQEQQVSPASSPPPSVSESTQESIVPTAEEPAVANAERYGGVLDLVWQAASDTFDPHYTTGWASYFWSQNVFETALVRDADGKPQPMVCDFELSDDQLTLKLQVREGVTFHDGTAVTIEDVVASLDRAGMVAQVNQFFTSLTASCEIEGDTATYTFTEYSPNTLYYISGEHTWSAILPKEVCEKYGENPITEMADAIGTGPYTLTEARLGVVFTMDRYDGYVPTPEGGTGMAAPKHAYMDRINVWVNGDKTSRAMALISGEYDSVELPEDYVEMTAPYDIVTSMDGLTSMLYMPFNTKSNRPVNDPNLRKAIAAVLDYEAIRKFAWAGIDAAEYCPTAGLYYSDRFNKADYAGAENIELAKQYLAASEYKGEELVIIASTTNADVTPIIKAQMEKIGISSRIDYMDSSTLSAFRSDNSNDYDIVFVSSAVGSYVPSTLAANFRTTFWGSEKKDELFGIIASELYGSEASLKAWDELAALWVEECPIVTVGTSGTKWFSHPDLVINMTEGTRWCYFYNAYWTNPGAHMD